MAGSFAQAFAAEGLVPKKSGWPRVFGNPSVILLRPMEPYITQDSSIPKEHKKILKKFPLQIGMILDIPYDFKKAEIDIQLRRRRCMITAIVIGKDEQPVGIIFNDERPKQVFEDKGLYGFEDKCLRPELSGRPNAAIDTGSRNFLSFGGVFFERVPVIGTLNDLELRKFSTYLGETTAQSVRNLNGRRFLDTDAKVYDLANIVPPCRPEIHTGSVIGCYFPHLPEQQPGKKLRPVVVCNTVFDDITGALVGLNVVPCKSRLDKSYPGDILIQQSDFHEGGAHFDKGSRALCDQIHIVPVTIDYFGSEFVLYGKLTKEALERVQQRCQNNTGISSVSQAPTAAVVLNPDWRLSRNPALAPVMPPSCRIR